MQRGWRNVILACCAAAGAGCSTALFTEPYGRPLIPAIDRVYLFVTPKEIRDESLYPPGRTHEKLIWEGNAFHWEISFPADGYAYAGLQFKYHTDLTSVFDRGTLIFTVTPAAAATNLAVALVDGTNRPARVLVEVPLRAAPLLMNPNVALVRVPLRNFPTEGMPVDDESASTAAPFDPTDLREIRILSGGGLHGVPVSIGFLRVEH